MSRLQELIAELCPDGVEYRALGEVGELVKGSGLQKKDFVDEGVGCIHYGQIHTQFGAYTDHVVAHVSHELASKLLEVNPGDVVVAVTSEDVSACCKAVAWVGNEVVVTGGHSVVIRHGLDSKFLSYCFQTDDFYKQKKRYAAGVKVIEMRTDKLARIRIPVPPIEIQREVVRILDEYTAAHDELITRLDEEIELRTRQFSCCFERILQSTESETILLSDLADMTYGFTAKASVDGEVRIIRITDISQDGRLLHDDPRYIIPNEESATKMICAGDLVVARTGGSFGKTLLYKEDTPAVYASFLIKLDLDGQRLDKEYYWFFSRSNLYWSQANKLVSTGGQPQFNANALKKVLVPVPTISKQREIISTMHKLDKDICKLVTMLSDERRLLNENLVLVRNQLLSFSEKKA